MKTLTTLVKLVSGTLDTFKGSTIEEQRKIVNLVLENLKLNGHKLEFMLRSPFDAFVKTTKIEEWYL